MTLETIKENTVFRRVYHRGKSFVHPALVTYVMKNRAGHCRIGITSSKKIGNAVTRNRARRVIRAALLGAEPSICGGYDIVFVARSRTAGCKSTDLAPVITSHLTEAGCMGKRS